MDAWQCFRGHIRTGSTTAAEWSGQFGGRNRGHILLYFTQSCSVTDHRRTTADGQVDTIFTADARNYDDEVFLPVEVPAGSLIIIHGEVSGEMAVFDFLSLITL